MDAIVEYYYNSWIEFLAYEPSKDSVFRGQSNKQLKGNEKNKEGIERWCLISSYHRDRRPYNFLTSGFHESDSIKKFSYLYKVEPFKSLLKEENKLSVIDFLQVLQHYGFKTPLIDFTRDKLTALYFAAIDLSAHMVSHDVYRNEQYFSVFELNAHLLQKHFNIIDTSKSLLANKWEVLEDQRFYRELINSKESDQPFVYTVLNPNYIINRNAKKQSGVFILFDSTEDFYADTNLGFDGWLTSQTHDRGIILDEPILKVHNICHDSIIVDKPPNCTNMFAYLMSKNRIGFNLFAEDDLQGLKLDYNNELAIRTLKCVNNKSNCDCIKSLSLLGIS